MRKIKFRGFHEDSYGKETIYVNGRKYVGKWVYGTGIVEVHKNTYKTNEIELIQEVNYDELDYFIPSYYVEDVIPETVSQYINSKDNNGKEIYENDVVNIYDWGKSCELLHTGKVYWNEEELRFDIEPFLDIELDDLWSKAVIKVIGTIFDKEVKE